MSQNHASKVTQILNVLADKLLPNQYNSDFAVQVTSGIDHSQRMTIDFRNNGLNGQSKANENYRTSKTRVCVTVGMMTTGYDCTDILNLCLMRPVYSPSEFIQMKGRGTRKNDFKFHWISPNEIPDHVDSVKDKFNLFDFFGNYEYFEKDFDYDEVLKLPQRPSVPINDPIDVDPVSEATNYEEDPIKFIEEIVIGEEGMKIDRDLYRSFRSVVTKDPTIRDFVKKMEFNNAEKYLEENILDKPEEFFTLEKLRRSLELDRKLNVSELLLHALGHIDRIKSKDECLEDEFEKLQEEINLSDEDYYKAKQFFTFYLTDDDVKRVIDEKKYGDLHVHPIGDEFFSLSNNLKEEIPQYIKKNINMELFSNA